MKHIYLFMCVDADIFDDDFPNGNFYAGYTTAKDEEDSSKIISSFRDRINFTYHPHKKNAPWNKPEFDESTVKEFDFTGYTTFNGVLCRNKGNSDIFYYLHASAEKLTAELTYPWKED